MSETIGNNEGQENVADTPSDGLLDGKDAEARQAALDYQHSREQYGGGRSLHAPEGRYKGVEQGVKFTYTPQTTRGSRQSRYSGRQYGHKRTSSHTQHVAHHTPVHWSDTAYAKGEGHLTWWGKVKRWLGIHV